MGLQMLGDTWLRTGLAGGSEVALSQAGKQARLVDA
jgi:hypothetical protein